MQSAFSLRLDQILGPRQIFHVMECNNCGYDEFYFQHPQTKKQIGIVCEGCNYIFAFENEVHELRISKEALASSPEKSEATQGA